jgi:fimbrial chaperone protein
VSSRLVRFFYFAFLLCISAAPVAAASFSVNPVRVEFSPNRSAATLTVTSLSDAPLTIQTQLLAWSAEQSRDVLNRTDEVLLNPPIFTLAPHGKQVLRLGLRKPIAANAEIAYRLILEEVPTAPPPGFQGVRTLLRVSLPIFARPSVPVSAALSWGATRTDTGALQVSATNLGNAHIQIKQLELSSAEVDGPKFRKSTPDYLLPRQSRSWTIADNTRPGTRIRIVALTDGKEIRAEVVAK